MLLSQQPITSDTAKLVELVAGYGLRIRLLNLRYEDLERAVGMRERGGVDVGRERGDGGRDGGRNGGGMGEWRMEIPSREGVDEEFWYDIGGA